MTITWPPPQVGDHVTTWLSHDHHTGIMYYSPFTGEKHTVMFTSSSPWQWMTSTMPSTSSWLSVWSIKWSYSRTKDMTQTPPYSKWMSNNLCNSKSWGHTHVCNECTLACRSHPPTSPHPHTTTRVGYIHILYNRQAVFPFTLVLTCYIVTIEWNVMFHRGMTCTITCAGNGELLSVLTALGFTMQTLTRTFWSKAFSTGTKVTQLIDLLA